MSKYKKDLSPRNKKEEPHGYWHVIFESDRYYKGHYVNGKATGYWEMSNLSVEHKITKEYYIL